MTCHFPRLIRLVAEWAAHAEDLHEYTVLCTSPALPMHVRFRWVGLRKVYERLIEFPAVLEDCSAGFIWDQLDKMRDQLGEEIRTDYARPRRRRRRRE